MRGGFSVTYSRRASACVTIECEGCGESFHGRSVKDVSAKLRAHLGKSFPVCDRPVSRRLPVDKLSWSAGKVLDVFESIGQGSPVMGGAIETRTGFSARTVNSAIRELQESGAIIVRRDYQSRGVAYTFMGVP